MDPKHGLVMLTWLENLLGCAPKAEDFGDGLTPAPSRQDKSTVGFWIIWRIRVQRGAKLLTRIRSSTLIFYAPSPLVVTNRSPVVSK